MKTKKNTKAGGGAVSVMPSSPGWVGSTAPVEPNLKSGGKVKKTMKSSGGSVKCMAKKTKSASKGK